MLEKVDGWWCYLLNGETGGGLGLWGRAHDLIMLNLRGF